MQLWSSNIAAFDSGEQVTETCPSPRFSLEGLLRNMPYPDGDRFTWYLRSTWLDNNNFTACVLSQRFAENKSCSSEYMADDVNEKTPRILLWVVDWTLRNASGFVNCNDLHKVKVVLSFLVCLKNVNSAPKTMEWWICDGSDNIITYLLPCTPIGVQR